MVRYGGIKFKSPGGGFLVDYRLLGRGGLKASKLCLGAMSFARQTPEAVGLQMLDHFVARGGNFIGATAHHR